MLRIKFKIDDLRLPNFGAAPPLPVLWHRWLNVENYNQQVRGHTLEKKLPQEARKLNHQLSIINRQYDDSLIRLHKYNLLIKQNMGHR